MDEKLRLSIDWLIVQLTQDDDGFECLSSAYAELQRRFWETPDGQVSALRMQSLTRMPMRRTDFYNPAEDLDGFAAENGELWFEVLQSVAPPGILAALREFQDEGGWRTYDPVRPLPDVELGARATGDSTPAEVARGRSVIWPEGPPSAEDEAAYIQRCPGGWRRACEGRLAPWDGDHFPALEVRYAQPSGRRQPVVMTGPVYAKYGGVECNRLCPIAICIRRTDCLRRKHPMGLRIGEVE